MGRSKSLPLDEFMRPDIGRELSTYIDDPLEHFSKV
jgi:hypothetical protein